MSNSSARARASLPQLAFELLEHRRLLACTVDIFLDLPPEAPRNGGHTLRDCVDENNAGNNPGGMVNFDTGTHTIPLDAGQGPIVVSRDIIIMDMPPSPPDGGRSGGIQITVDGENQTQIFDIEPSVDSAVISYVELTGGNGTPGRGLSSSNGGAILNQGGLTLDHVLITGNTASNGGGIWNDPGSRLVVRDSTFSENVATSEGGAIAGAAADLTIEDSGLFVNQATEGGALSSFGGSIEINGSEVIANTAAISGGGIQLQGDFTAVIEDSTINSNTATGQDANAQDGIGTAGKGGAIATMDRGRLVVRSSVIELNVAESHIGGPKSLGGGFHNSDGATVLLERSSVMANSSSAGPGGGIANATEDGDVTGVSVFTVDDSTIAFNSILGNADGGAGIWNDNGSLFVHQSTISGNSGGRFGAGVADASDVTSVNVSTRIDRSTIALNESSAGGGGVYAIATADLTVRNSILSGNLAGATASDLAASPHAVKDVAYSLVAVDETGQLKNKVDGNIVGIASRLTALRDNGGPTLTHAPILGDVTVNAAANEGAGESDQRGFGPRDASGGMDMGAVEFSALPIMDANFNGDDTANCADVNALSAAVAAGTNSPPFDLTGEGLVTEDDILRWLDLAGARPEHFDKTGGLPFLQGDANLDGVVDAPDFIRWNENRFGPAVYCDGDFNGDGVADALDFVIWDSNKFSLASPQSHFVPALREQPEDEVFGGYFEGTVNVGDGNPAAHELQDLADLRNRQPEAIEVDASFVEWFDILDPTTLRTS